MMVDAVGWAPEDELRHADAPVEAWWWWGASTEPDLAGVVVGLELRGRRFDYWAGLVRAGDPYLYVEELDGTGLRGGLEIKPPEMWAGHECDAPFAQWSLGNEAHGVLLDDPDEAWRRAHGDVVPCTFDIEWYASSATEELPTGPGAHGYSQRGEIDARVELIDGVVELRGPGQRVHVWGAPHLPTSFAMPTPDGERSLRAPYRRHDGVLVDQVLTGSGRWFVRRADRP